MEVLIALLVFVAIGLVLWWVVNLLPSPPVPASGKNMILILVALILLLLFVQKFLTPYLRN